jgi:hypothetical protein
MATHQTSMDVLAKWNDIPIPAMKMPGGCFFAVDDSRFRRLTSCL